MSRRKPLSQWARELLAGGMLTGDRKVKTFTLVHYQGSVEKELHTFLVGSSNPVKPEDLAEMWENIAQTDAQGIKGTGTEQYAVIAHFDGGGEPARYPFIKGGQDPLEEGGGLGTESATKNGLFAQLMRHTEASVRMSLSSMQQMNAQMMGMFQMVMQENQELRSESIDVLNIFKQMVIDKAKDDHKLKMEQLEYKRSSDERAALLGMIAPLVNQFTGREVFPMSLADTQLIDTMARKLTAEDLAKVSEVVSLPPELMGLLMSRIEKTLKQDREAKEALVKVNGSSMTKEGHLE